MSNPTAINAARKHLKDCGLPPALLPDTLDAFEIDENTGRFVVRLSRTTVLRPGKHEVTYQQRITGRLAAHRLEDLQGISVKVLFAHPTVSKVESDDALTTVTFHVMGTAHDVAFDLFA